MTDPGRDLDLGADDVSPSPADLTDWVRSAYAHVPTHDDVLGPSWRTHVRRWEGGPGRPVILVHGGAAHSGWWDHIGPWLAVDRPVTALDLTGHGDSDRRCRYSLGGWAAEVLAVIEASGVGAPGVLLVGHSMGGLVALAAAQHAPPSLTGLIVLDAAARDLTDTQLARRAERAGRPNPVFPSREVAIAKFRTLGDRADRCQPDVLAHVAAGSITETQGGWTWKVDRRIWLRDAVPAEQLEPLGIPARLVRAEHGLLSESDAAAMARRCGPAMMVSTFAGVGHHLMLDEPVALVASLRGWLAEFEAA